MCCCDMSSNNLYFIVVLLKWVTWVPQSRIEQCMSERRAACEPAVEDEEAGARAEEERTEDC